MELFFICCGFASVLWNTRTFSQFPQHNISLSEIKQEFHQAFIASYRHAHLPHSSRPRCIRFGNISDEATIRSKGAIQPRQCGLKLIVAPQDGDDGIIGRVVWWAHRIVEGEPQPASE